MYAMYIMYISIPVSKPTNLRHTHTFLCNIELTITVLWSINTSCILRSKISQEIIMTRFKERSFSSIVILESLPLVLEDKYIDVLYYIYGLA